MSFFQRSSSVLTLSPQPAHRSTPFARMNSPANIFPRFPSPAPRTAQSTSLGALAQNRKRSRDDDDEDMSSLESHNRPRRIAVPKRMAAAAANAPANQPVDELAIHLGLGWRRLATDDHIQAALRGWARYIETHYPLTNVNITLESKALQSYLVESAQGFFLFSEDLKQGRLVSNTREGVLQNLKTTPPVFDPASYVMMATPNARV